jgi:hypothetical protein
MKRFILVATSLLMAFLLGLQSAQAGRPVSPQVPVPQTPVLQTAASGEGQAIPATEVGTSDLSATWFILGMSLLLLLPVGLELMAPGTVGRRFQLHHDLMSRRALP